jgi:predicted transposase YbfD/YdcC
LVPIAIDGESARAARRDTATGCLHVVTARAAESRLVLGAEGVADGSNEVAAIPELLAALDLRGAIVTIDAAGCQVESARLIRERGGHYLLAVKDNQPTLRRAVEAAFAAACEADFEGIRHDGCESSEAGHGRREAGGERTSTAHYYLTSHPGTAEELAAIIRGHWDVENPQPEDPRSDNLCVAGGADYHRRRRPLGVGRVERQEPSGPRRHLMLDNDSICVPPRPRLLRRTH